MKKQFIQQPFACDLELCRKIQTAIIKRNPPKQPKKAVSGESELKSP